MPNNTTRGQEKSPIHLHGFQSPKVSDVTNPHITGISLKVFGDNSTSGRVLHFLFLLIHDI